MIDAAQIRMARAGLDWTQRKLADEAQVPVSSVKAIESGKDTRVSILAAIEKTFTAAGIVFLEEGGRGVRFRE